MRFLVTVGLIHNRIGLVLSKVCLESEMPCQDFVFQFGCDEIMRVNHYFVLTMTLQRYPW